MNAKLKEFFRPTKGKILFSFTIFIISTAALTLSLFSPLGPLLHFKTGFPLDIFNLCFLPFYCPRNIGLILWQNLIIDLIFCYLIACIFIFIYKKIRKQKRQFKY